VRVDLGPRSYAIEIGAGTLPALGRAVARATAARRALIVADGNVADSHAAIAAASLQVAGIGTRVVAVPPGEPSKTLQGAGRLYDACLEAGCDRASVIVAVGGGVCGDLAGFVAGTYMRGIDWIQVPTTLLAQIDASVGGKVAVDHPRGKNLIGAFHQPRLVWCDVRTLDTLPLPDLASGMAEAVKNGLLGDVRYYRFVRRRQAELLARESVALLRLVAGSCRIKAAVVAADEREDVEGDPGAALRTRMVLNLGHTLGNNLEAVAGYGTLRHGEAVAIGMVCAGRLALAHGLWSARWQAELEDTLQGLGLPIRIPGLGLGELMTAIQMDKKTVGGIPRWVLPVRPGTVTVRTDVTAAVVAEVLAGMGAVA
jgi:3-dehydroquinate synthase